MIVRKRKFGRVLVLLAVFAIATLLWLRRYGGRLEQAETNPDKSFRAEVRISTSLGATDADAFIVKLYSTFHPLGDGVFTALNYGGKVRVAWQDPTHLVVHLQHPDQLQIYGKSERWNDVFISYQND
jgi:hypothetical protein